MPESDKTDVRAQLLEVLMQRLQNERFPSATDMDMIEDLLEPDEVPVYVEALMSRIRTDTYPSVPMLARVKRLAT